VSGVERVIEAAAHAAAQSVAQGCCCCVEIELLGWDYSPRGEWCPVLAARHDEWCPLLRSREVPAMDDAVTWVHPGEDGP
jgi:hypothetical protein